MDGHDPGSSEALIGAGFAAGLGVIAWFFKRFFKWPIGELKSRDGAIGETRLVRLEGIVNTLKDEMALARADRMAFQETILDKLDEHGQASARGFGDLSDRVSRIEGRLEIDPPRRRGR